EQRRHVVGRRVQAEEMPAGKEDDVPDEVVVAAEGGEKKRQKPVAPDTGEMGEVVREEVDAGDREVHPRAQREGHENQRMPSAGSAGAVTPDGTGAGHEGRDASGV